MTTTSPFAYAYVWRSPQRSITTTNNDGEQIVTWELAVPDGVVSLESCTISEPGRGRDMLKPSGQHLHVSQRKHERCDVKIMADIRVSGGLRNKVRVIDLSRTGFQMECLVYIPADRPVFLTMPGFTHIECSVVWRSDWHYGCTFAAPLHEAIYDHIVDLYPQILPVNSSYELSHSNLC